MIVVLLLCINEEERKRIFKDEIKLDDDGEFQLEDDDINTIFDGEHLKNYNAGIGVIDDYFEERKKKLTEEELIKEEEQLKNNFDNAFLNYVLGHNEAFDKFYKIVELK